MKKTLFLIVILMITKISTSQTYYYYSETQYTYGPYYFDQSMGLVRDVLQERKNENLRREYIEKMKERTKAMRDYYESMPSYPEKVVDGWHDVSILVGNDFIDSRKVLVENNKIKKVVWDNWMEEEITFSGPIINAKSAVQFKKPTKNLQGLVEVFFMNSIADPNSSTEAPLEAAVLTFYTKSDYYKTMSVEIDGYSIGNFMHQFDNVECEELNALNVYLKPGTYEFQAFASGPNALITEKLILKSGECKVIEIVKPLTNYEKKKIARQKKKEEKAKKKAEKSE